MSLKALPTVSVLIVDLANSEDRSKSQRFLWVKLFSKLIMKLRAQMVFAQKLTKYLFFFEGYHHLIHFTSDFALEVLLTPLLLRNCSGSVTLWSSPTVCSNIQQPPVHHGWAFFMDVV